MREPRGSWPFTAASRRSDANRESVANETRNASPGCRGDTISIHGSAANDAHLMSAEKVGAVPDRIHGDGMSHAAVKGEGWT